MPTARGRILAQEARMFQQWMAKALVQALVQSILREQLGCKDVTIVVKWGDDGTNWSIELTGLPAPHRCLEVAENIASELRAKYRLEKDRLPEDDLMMLLLNETLAEPGLKIPFLAPPRPKIGPLPASITGPNWTATPGGPVTVEYVHAFNRVVTRLQKQVELLE
jgi:hypothetical protein